jgi:hypothetical protein
MSRNRRKGSATDFRQPRSSSLEAKPPTLLQNIAWFLAHWREHKFVIAIALAIIGAPTFYGAGNFWPKEAKTSPTPSGRNEKTVENSSPPLRVRFRDGTSGYVELSFAFALEPATAVKVHQNYGDPRRAVADLKEAVVGAVYKSMETLTIEEVRTHREQIEASIVELTKEAQARTGHTIYQVSLKRIEQTR